MVTQLLFGETYELLEVLEKWTKVRLDADGYECWVDNKQITPINEEEHSRLRSSSPFKSANLLSTLDCPTGKIILPMGASLWGLSKGAINIAGVEYPFSGEAIDSSLKRRSTIPNLSHQFLNTPYLWGGRSPAGMDCSGFTQFVFSMAGIQLPRDAYQQAECGQPVELTDAAPCDLAFFRNDQGRITHVGIVLQDNTIIHASGRVRIDQLNSAGILTEEGQLTHSLAHISRI